MKTGLIIGRFQPFHNGHYELLKYCERKSDDVIIIIGSANKMDRNNPWSVFERVEMIRSVSSEALIAYVNDYDSDKDWIKEIKEIVEQNDNEITLYGHKKDDTSKYLEWFPGWEYCDIGIQASGISGTEVRRIMFEEKRITSGIPYCVKSCLIRQRWEEKFEPVPCTKDASEIIMEDRYSE